MPPQKILHYEIRERIGQGGMGEVYRARDTRLGRDVAIKILPPEFDQDPERVQRFEQEARTASALNHPHIVSIFDTGHADGRRFIAMELVEGESLTSWVGQEKPGLRRILEVFTQVADALTAAHEAGIVHRDIKPANLLVARQGYAKVVDFGLAKLTQAEEDSAGTKSIHKPISRTGVIVGTPAYMSPEQAGGRRIDARTDIFSLGAVLYEALTGRRAFAGTSDIDVLHAILHSHPQPLRATDKLTPAELQWIVDKALAKELEERYQSMREFAADLRRLRARLESGSSGAIEPQVLSASVQRSRLVPVLMGTTVIAVGALAALVFLPAARNWLAPAPEGPRKEAIVTQLTNYGGTERSGALSPDGKYFAFVSEKGGPPDIWVRQISGGDPIQITHDAAAEVDLVYSPDGESIYFATLGIEKPEIWRVGSLGGAPQKLVDRARYPCLSPDGKQLGYAKTYRVDFNLWVGDGAIEIAKTDGTSPRKAYEGKGIGQLQWSPDGRWISFTLGLLFDARNVLLLDVQTGATRPVTREVTGTTHSQAWLPDSKHLLVSRSYDAYPLASTADLGIVPVYGGAERRLTLNVNTRFILPSISSNGSRLLVTAENMVHELWRVPLGPDPKANGAAATRLLDSALDPFWIHGSQDGSVILFNSRATGGRNLWTVPADFSAPPRQITRFSGNLVTHASLSPDGKQVAYISLQTTPSQVWVANVDGSSPTQLTHDNNQHYWPIWSPDGKWVAFGSAAGGLWKIPVGGGEPVQITKGGGFRRADWAPAGNRIALFAATGGVEIADATSGQISRELPIRGWQWAMPVWNREGDKFTLVGPNNYLNDAVWIVDGQTGEKKLAVQFPGRFHLIFRAVWGKDGASLLVNRNETVSHIVLLENF